MDVSDMLSSKASFLGGLGERVVVGCCLSVGASFRAIAVRVRDGVIA